MSAIAVQEIFDKIRQLPEDDRLLLEQRLAEWADSEWGRAAAEARNTARSKGIDQATIDRAIEELRHPQ